MSSVTTLEVNDIIGLHEAFQRLDGYNRPEGEGHVFLPFDFDFDTRWNLSKDRRIIRAEYAAYDECRNDLVVKYSPKHHDMAKEGPEAQAQFYREHRDLLLKKREVSGLLRVKKDAVKKAGPIPVSVLEGLTPIIDES